MWSSYMDCPPQVDVAIDTDIDKGRNICFSHYIMARANKMPTMTRSIASDRDGASRITTSI